MYAIKDQNATGMRLIQNQLYFKTDWNPLQKPCAALGSTRSDLRHVTVIFASLEPSSDKILNSTKLSTTANTTTAKPTVEKVKKEESFNEFRGVMESFYQCYGERGGLKVNRIKFEKVYDKDTGNFTSCRIKFMEGSWWSFSGRQIRLIISVDLAKTCGVSPVQFKIFISTGYFVQLNSTRVLSLCHPARCPNNKSFSADPTFPVIQVSAEFMLYERLERHVDLLNNTDFFKHFNFNNATENLDIYQKYTYFSSVPHLFPSVFSSILAVLLILLFFFTSLLLCCCGLFMMTLVEEDFVHRDDERNWLATQVRLEEYNQMEQDDGLSPVVDQIEVVNKNDEMSDDVSTARSRLAGSQQSLAMDSTQISETEHRPRTTSQGSRRSQSIHASETISGSTDTRAYNLD
uniref:Uncharacterized protein n=1 Tax=Caenorhabditis japonica TaxID=281687 RepID=A0A8R1DNK7_CAEJA